MSALNAVTTDYDPWEHLRQFPDVALEEHEPSTSSLAGFTFFPTLVSLRSDLSKAEARSTLAHEIVHLERGPIWDSLCERGGDAATTLEEGVVDLVAASRLIPSALILHLESMDVSLGRQRLAELLGIDGGTVRAGIRLATALAQSDPRTTERD